tara:strand:+ start:198 stop:386 length:189 start_codon:yes stop_codon:yes gene_type:complete
MYTDRTPSKRLINKYEKNLKNSPFCIKIRFSIENAENVVNPPQNPTVKKINVIELGLLFFKK